MQPSFQASMFSMRMIEETAFTESSASRSARALLNVAFFGGMRHVNERAGFVVFRFRLIDVRNGNAIVSKHLGGFRKHAELGRPR